MSERKKVDVRVKESTRDEWKEYANREDTIWKDRSHLIRGAVRYEIEGTHLKNELEEIVEKHGAELDQDELAEALENALSETSERISRVEDNLADLSEQLQTSESITELAKELQADWLVALPEEMEPVDINIEEGARELMTEESLARLAGSATAYAEVMGYEEHTARRALRRAENIYPSVKSVVDPETTRKRYYVEDSEMDDPRTTEDENSDEFVATLIENHGGFQSGLYLKESMQDGGDAQ